MGNWTHCGCLSDARGLRISYLANLTAPWCAVYLRTCDLTNLWGMKPGKMCPIQKVGIHLIYKYRIKIFCTKETTVHVLLRQSDHKKKTVTSFVSLGFPDLPLRTSVATA